MGIIVGGTKRAKKLTRGCGTISRFPMFSDAAARPSQPFKHHGGTIMLAPFQPDPTSADVAEDYVQTNLVSDIPGVATAFDPHLVNPWGVSFRMGSPFWVSNQGDDSTTL